MRYQQRVKRHPITSLSANVEVLAYGRNRCVHENVVGIFIGLLSTRQSARWGRRECRGLEAVQILRVKTPEARGSSVVCSVLKPGIEVTKLGKDRKDNIISGKSSRCCSRLTLKLFRYTYALLDFSQNRWRVCSSVNGETLFSSF